MFLFSYTLLICSRALWLDDPLTIPLHQLQNGALLIFAFFMLSDPKTTPDTKVDCLIFGGVVASIACTIQYAFCVPNGTILALVMSAPLVPLIDLMLRGDRYRWSQPDKRSVNRRTAFSTDRTGVL